MTDEETLAYSAIDRWEREGEYPDDDEFTAIVMVWRGLIATARRFEAVVDACEEAEHLRRSVRENGSSFTEDDQATTDTQ